MKQMRQTNRQIKDKKIICGILDMINTIHIGINDSVYPYVVPMNFGYDFDENLIFYIHCAKTGYKTDLLEKNPNVCVTLSAFNNFPDRSYKGHIHDFRSVMAFGKAEEINFIENKDEFNNAIQAILRHNARKPDEFEPALLNVLRVFKIICLPDMVFGKAEIVPKTPEEVPFVDVYSIDKDNVPDDFSHILDMKK